MSTQVQLRRGTTVQHSTFTGAAGEVTVDTTLNTAVVHDASTAGGIPLSKASHTHTLAALGVENTDQTIASATTCDIGAATGENVIISGTTTITGLGTVANGVIRRVKFTGALLLTYNATSLIIPGSANITTANGDTMEVESLGSGNWVVRSYMKRDGTPLVSSSAAPFSDATALIKGSGDTSKLVRFEVDGLTTATTRVITVPDADITLARSDAAQTLTGVQTFSTDISVGGDVILTGAAKGIIFEGTTADAFETTLTAGEPTADRAIVMPDKAGTLVVGESATTSGITMNTARILGRTTASSGAIEEITVGTGLSLSAGSLTATGSVGITLGTAVASTSGTSIDFTGIPSGTKRITINFAGVSTSGSDTIYIQLGDAGGVEATAYLGSGGNMGGPTFTNYTTSFAPNTAAGSVVVHGTVILTLVNAATFTWVCIGHLGRSDSNNGHIFGGSKSTSAELDRVRITTSAGSDTFDAGQINITYE